MPSLLRLLLAAILTALSPTLAQADNWLVLSGLSMHFQQDRRDWREQNPGIGFETTLPFVEDLSLSAGYFRNSYDRHALYGGVRFMPLKVGPLQFGGYLLASTGYPSPVLLLPGASLEMGPVGVNLVALPNLPGYSGYLGVQLRLRLP
jgi:hypothetical protein